MCMCVASFSFIFQKVAVVRNMAMAFVIDSEATFEQQASEAGLSQPWIRTIVWPQWPS